MDRRTFQGDPYFARGFPAVNPFFPAAASTQQRSTEEELVARSKEWMSRQEERSKDPWRRSVDDFLDKGTGRYKNRDRSSRDRSRSRSRERDRKRRTSRERSRNSSRDRRRSSEDEDSRDARRHERSDRYDHDRGSRHDRYDRRYREEDDDNSRKYSSDDEENSYEKSENGDYDSRPYADSSLRAEDRFAYKKQTPQRTVIIRGLAQHITEEDIQEDIINSHLMCRDIRLVRRKDTGTSRGFAFVEFKTVEDATKWIEMKQGELMLKDHFRALLQYSLPKDHSYGRDKWTSDWYCKCQAHNFRRRDTCFKCNLSRKEGEVMEGTDEVSSHPTNTVLLRGLDFLTTEESVLQSIKSLSSLPIRSVRIGRYPSTNISRGVCYLEMNSVVDAMYLYNALITNPPIVDARTTIISYAKLDPLTLHSSAAISGQIATAAVAAAQWSHQKSDTTQYKLSDVPRLAEYSASLYATTPQEKTAYLSYYEDYYKKQIADGVNISLPADSQAGLANAQAAVAAHRKMAPTKGPLAEPPDGSGDKSYPVPDVSSYQFDKTSGYYYDPYSTLYYDANSQYYYNNKTGQFLYWDSSKNTYLPAPTDPNNPHPASAPRASQDTKEEEQKKDSKESEKDKVKVAKRIAKDMERWAKTLNQKKEIAKQNIVAAQQAAVAASTKAAGAADIGYAVLERKDLSLPPVIPNGMDAMSQKESLVAAYGQGSDSEEDNEENSLDVRNLVDWTKIACLLCKRQFPSKDVLIKHTQLSDLHKQNLQAYIKSKNSDSDEGSSRSKQYRDRAKERRLKYGEPDTPQPSRLKESYMKGKEAVVNYEEPTKAGIGSDNLGSKLLQKMGWQEGMGLGKKNQGRTSIIQTDRRAASAGLGTKSIGVTPGPGETYKDCVKKMMAIRYNEIDGQS